MKCVFCWETYINKLLVIIRANIRGMNDGNCVKHGSFQASNGINESCVFSDSAHFICHSTKIFNGSSHNVGQFIRWVLLQEPHHIHLCQHFVAWWWFHQFNPSTTLWFLMRLTSIGTNALCTPLLNTSIQSIKLHSQTIISALFVLKNTIKICNYSI